MLRPVLGRRRQRTDFEAGGALAWERKGVRDARRDREREREREERRHQREVREERERNRRTNRPRETERESALQCVLVHVFYVCRHRHPRQLPCLVDRDGRRRERARIEECPRGHNSPLSTMPIHGRSTLVAEVECHDIAAVCCSIELCALSLDFHLLASMCGVGRRGSGRWTLSRAPRHR